MMRGFTDNYIPIYFGAPESFSNTIVAVTIDRLVDQNVFGHLTGIEDEKG